jgi:dihydrofolate reductase
MTILSLILARAHNGVIGKNNALPWHLPEDMAYFKKTTLGKPVIMGRKTWESLPPKFRPLPGRRNIVVTRNANWYDAGAARAMSLQAALGMVEFEPEVFVIGGAQLYAEAMLIAQRIYLTQIEHAFEGDAFFPALDTAQWSEVSRDPHHHAGRPAFDFSFVVYERAAV